MQQRMFAYSLKYCSATCMQASGCRQQEHADSANMKTRIFRSPAPSMEIRQPGNIKWTRIAIRLRDRYVGFSSREIRGGPYDRVVVQSGGPVRQGRYHVEGYKLRLEPAGAPSETHMISTYPTDPSININGSTRWATREPTTSAGPCRPPAREGDRGRVEAQRLQAIGLGYRGEAA